MAFLGLPAARAAVLPVTRSAVLAAVLALAAPLAACGGDAPEAQIAVRGLELQRRGTAYPKVSGYVYNAGRIPIRSVDVSVTLYDDDNLPIEDLLLQVRDIPPSDSVRFERGLDLVPNSVRLKYVGVN